MITNEYINKLRLATPWCTRFFNTVLDHFCLLRVSDINVNIFISLLALLYHGLQMEEKGLNEICIRFNYERMALRV